MCVVLRPGSQHAYVPACLPRHTVQGVRYIVGDDDDEDVCKNTFTGDVQWRNATDPVSGVFSLVPTYTKTSVNGWAYDCDFRPSEEHPHGQFCTPFKNPEADDFPEDVKGYNAFDNILLSWIIVFQHVRAACLWIVCAWGGARAG